MDPIPDPVLAALASLDTPTVCNALEVALPERRGFGYTTRPLVSANPDLPPVVGYARTARIRARSAAPLDEEGIRRQRLAYYTYIQDGPRPSVVVIQDLDDPPGAGAFWGEVQSNIHKGLGCVATVTNGSVRDIPDCADGFRMHAGSIGPSHAFVHLVDFDVPVSVHGMGVEPGDLVHVDRHGAVVVPVDVASGIPDLAARIARREAVILQATKENGFDVEALAEAFGNAVEVH